MTADRPLTPLQQSILNKLRQAELTQGELCDCCGCDHHELKAALSPLLSRGIVQIDMGAGYAIVRLKQAQSLPLWWQPKN